MDIHIDANQQQQVGGQKGHHKYTFNLSEKCCSTPAICTTVCFPIGITVPSCLLCLETKETPQYTSHLRFCTAMRFEKVLAVGVSAKFLMQRGGGKWGQACSAMFACLQRKSRWFSISFGPSFCRILEGTLQFLGELFTSSGTEKDLETGQISTQNLNKTPSSSFIFLILLDRCAETPWNLQAKITPSSYKRL